MFIALKTKIWLTILTIVLLFTFFTLYYFPDKQGETLLKNYNNEVQNLARTVALGVEIALNEQNYEGVRTAMEFVKGTPGLKFVSLLQIDSVWDKDHAHFEIRKSVFKTFPDSVQPDPAQESTDSIIIKRAPYRTSMLSGDIMLGFSTEEILASRQKVRQFSLFVSIGIFLVGLLIGLWLARNISVPVRALRDAAQRVGKGDLSQSINRFSRDEIGELSQAFNIMVEDISKSRAELSDSNHSLSATNKLLNTTLEDLKNMQNQLVQSEKMASLGELTAGIAHEIQNPLNFVNNFSELNTELVDEMKEEFLAGKTDDAISLANDIKNNNEKIHFHGKRADSIVKGMLQHSRSSSGQKEPTNINLLVDECLRLSYHGLRAKNKAFNAKTETNFDESLPEVSITSQDIGRVLLNLFTNAFYSVLQKQKSAKEDYSPVVTAKTGKTANGVFISVRDNGNGIPQKVIDKIFQPFFTTKPAGEGTGLGLSMSYEIIANGHGGELKVESKEGEFAEFIIILPV